VGLDCLVITLDSHPVVFVFSDSFSRCSCCCFKMNSTSLERDSFLCCFLNLSILGLLLLDSNSSIFEVTNHCLDCLCSFGCTLSQTVLVWFCSHQLIQFPFKLTLKLQHPLDMKEVIPFLLQSKSFFFLLISLSYCLPSFFLQDSGKFC